MGITDTLRRLHASSWNRCQTFPKLKSMINIIKLPFQQKQTNSKCCILFCRFLPFSQQQQMTKSEWMYEDCLLLFWWSILNNLWTTRNCNTLGPCIDYSYSVERKNISRSLNNKTYQFFGTKLYPILVLFFVLVNLRS